MWIEIIFLSLQCLHTEASLESGAYEGGDLYIGKSVILRFVFDTLESGSSLTDSQEQGNNDAHGYVISVSLIAVSHDWLSAIMIVCLHTGVGFGVARSTIRAMPEPLCVGRVARRFPRFFVFIATLIYLIANFWETMA